MPTSKSIIYSLLALSALLLVYCNQPAQHHIAGAANEFRNLHDSVKYVGMQTCRSCHAEIYDSFIQTGMGQSFDKATKSKSSAKFDKHAVVYDEDLDFYYKPYWNNDQLFIKEYRLQGTDTTYQRTEKIGYVIGSGQHTNSHLINENGYVYQAPITFYTQDGKWDMAPGFDNGASSRFSRIIASECMTCHNHLPVQVQGSQNKYEEVPTGIECERCHGPGEIHVREKLAGEIIDTSKYIDYSIVNPANLPVELEVDICQRCHLQGTAVLNDDKTFYDFRPGMPLNAVMNVFLPRYSNSHERFIMASQADRMRLSKCFTIGKVSCTKCHNPHQSIKSTSIETINAACIDCHNQPVEEVCSVPMSERVAKKNDCAGCHMPKSGSIDIPHVRITDHYIGKPITEQQKSDIQGFIGLECLTDEQPDDLLMAKGYIALYDKFVPEKQMLDSAKFFLDRSKAVPSEKLKTTVHYYFTKKDYTAVIRSFEQIADEQVKDAWTAYRIGDSYSQLRQPEKALNFLSAAVKDQPYNLDFQNKYGVAQMEQKQYDQAMETFQFIINENTKQPIAHNNLGFLYLLKGKGGKAIDHINKALDLDPDYEKAWLNKLSFLVGTKKMDEAKLLLNTMLVKFPKSEKIKQVKARLFKTL